MQSDDDEKKVSAYYGAAPTLAGVLIAAALIWFMFSLADGFA